MLIVTDKAKHAQTEAVIRTREIASDAAAHETRAATLVENKHKSVANAERQEGKRLPATEFMRRLRKINPNIIMEPHPNRHLPLHKDKACLYLLMPDGSKGFLMTVEGDYMPEWSLMSIKTVRVPDGRVEGFWREQKIPGREIKRGWRTVLLRLLHMGLVNITDVEREFGPTTRESWNVLAGKRSGRLLI